MEIYNQLWCMCQLHYYIVLEGGRLIHDIDFSKVFVISSDTSIRLFALLDVSGIENSELVFWSVSVKKVSSSKLPVLINDSSILIEANLLPNHCATDQSIECLELSCLCSVAVIMTVLLFWMFSVVW